MKYPLCLVFLSLILTLPAYGSVESITETTPSIDLDLTAAGASTGWSVTQNATLTETVDGLNIDASGGDSKIFKAFTLDEGFYRIEYRSIGRLNMRVASGFLSSSTRYFDQIARYRFWQDFEDTFYAPGGQVYILMQIDGAVDPADITDADQATIASIKITPIQQWEFRGASTDYLTQGWTNYNLLSSGINAAESYLELSSTTADPKLYRSDVSLEARPYRLTVRGSNLTIKIRDGWSGAQHVLLLNTGDAVDTRQIILHPAVAKDYILEIQPRSWQGEFWGTVDVIQIQPVIDYVYDNTAINDWSSTATVSQVTQESDHWKISASGGDAKLFRTINLDKGTYRLTATAREQLQIRIRENWGYTPIFNAIISQSASTWTTRELILKIPQSGNWIISTKVNGGAGTEAHIKGLTIEPLQRAIQESTFEIPSSGIPVNPHVFGIHHARLTDIIVLPDHDQQVVEDAIADLGFNIIRGPDGTAANYYLYRDGTVMNRTFPDLNTYLANFGDTTIGMVENIDLIGSRPPLYLADIYHEPNTLGLPLVFDFNVSSQNIVDFIQQLNSMRTIATQPIRIEFGNELYASANEFTFPSVNDYISKMAGFHNAVKNIDASIKVGMVAVGADLQDRVLVDGVQETIDENLEATEVDRINSWNSTLQQNSGIYDAAIIHITAPLNHLDNMDEDDVMDYFFSFNHSSSIKLEEQAASFPGKEIWITEWGYLPSVMFSKTGVERDKLQFMKTPGMALGRVDRLIDMLKDGVVDIATYHDLKGANGFGVVQFDQDSNGNPVFNLPMLKLPTYHVFKAIGDLANSHTTVYDLSPIAQSDRTLTVAYTRDVVRMPEVVAVGFGNTSSPSKAVFINRSRFPQTIQLDGKKLQPTWTYGGSEPLPDFKINPTFYAAPPQVNPDPAILTGTASDTLELQPYSMTICTIP